MTVDERVTTVLVDFVHFARNVVIDCSRLAAIDDRGAVMLDDMAAVAWRAGGTLAVHDPVFVVEQVIGFCGVSDRIRICSAGP